MNRSDDKLTIEQFSIRDDWLEVRVSCLSDTRLNILDMPHIEKIGIFCDEGRYHVFRMTCPHMGGDLAAGVFCRQKKTISCPWHGYIYDLRTGKFLCNPNQKIFSELKEYSQGETTSCIGNFSGRLPVLNYHERQNTIEIEIKYYASKI